MLFTPTPLPGLLLVDPERRTDERGFFARSFCAAEFAAQGLPTVFPQHNVSGNPRRGTLRGLHLQRPPHGEPKLVRCTGGAIFDVAVDVRPGSPTHGRWFGVELDAAGGRSLYIPPGFAHGFQTLTDDAEVLYLMGAMYVPEAATGLRWDDPDVGIVWPLPVSVVGERDRALPWLAGLAAELAPAV